MELLKNLRRNKGLLQKDIADFLGVERSTYVKYENGDIKPNAEILSKLATFFDVSVDYLLGRETQPLKIRRCIKLPVYERIVAKVPIEATEDIEEYEEIDEEMAAQGDLLALKISGHCMEPRICDGDVIILKKQSDCDEGQIAVVLVNGDCATCKKIKKSRAGITLIPLNPVYEPMFYSNKEIRELPVSIIGVVVELRGKF